MSITEEPSKQRMEGKVHGGVSAAALPFSGITLVSRGSSPGVIPSVMEPGGLSLHPYGTKVPKLIR